MTFQLLENGCMVIKQVLKVGSHEIFIRNVITCLNKPYFYATLSIMVGQMNNNNMDEFVVI